LARSSQEIYKEMISAAVSSGIGNYGGAGSALKELLSVYSFQLSQIEQRQDAVERNSHLNESRGAALDKWGRDLSVSRIQTSRAIAYMSDESVVLSTKNGVNFDELPGGGPVPRIGDRIIDNVNKKAYVVFQVPSTLAGTNRVFLGVKALADGQAGNALARTLNSHPYSKYERTVTVTNLYPVIGGADRESDDQYLARLLAAPVGSKKGTAEAVFVKLASMPGIGRYRILTGYGGNASLGVVVQPSVGISSPVHLVRAVEVALKQVVTAGTQLTVKNANTIAVKLRCSIKTNKVINATERSNLEIKVRRQLLAYFNRLSIGQSISHASIISVIKQSDSNIKTVGINNRELDRLVYRVNYSGATFSDEIRSGSNFTIEEDELIVLDEAPFDLVIS
jgi:uncharacterized phage protein gp47/JayE